MLNSGPEAATRLASGVEATVLRPDYNAQSFQLMLFAFADDSASKTHAH